MARISSRDLNKDSELKLGTILYQMNIRVFHYPR